MKNKISVATVFSGIGALEFALKRMNVEHDIIFACDNGEIEIEYDQKEEFNNIKSLRSIEEKKEYVDNLYNLKTRRTNFVKKSYLHNYPNCSENRFFQDINLLDGTDFKGKVDLFVGGSPCQSFSSVGSQAGLDDPRGNLFYEYIRLIKEIEPKVFIYENVRNLFTHDNGNTWKVIKGLFDDLDYNITEPQIINASDYGIPQTRRRLFIVGYKKNTNFNWPPKIKQLKYTMQDFLIDNCDMGGFNYNKNGEINIIASSGVVDDKYILTPKLHKYVMSSGTKSFYQKPVINLPTARTILKTMGNRHRAGVDNYVSKDGISTKLGDVRMLSEREAHRLMGFTDDYDIIVSRAQAYKQAGNSIVVDVMIQILNSIFKQGLLEVDED